jgi:preprotein translocase subunit SecA
MKTGEGRGGYFTSFLNALTKKGVHIVTVNDYWQIEIKFRWVKFIDS